MLEHLISTYGYIAVLIGTFLEGETILVLAGFASHRGFLDLQYVILAAFAGTFLGDQFYFYIGRSRGKQFLEKRPDWQRRSRKVLQILEKHQVWMILGFRFLYGLRTVTPFLIGASSISPIRFFVLNLIGGLTWAIVFGYGGYLFGHLLELLINDFKKYEMWALFGIVVLGSLIWIFHFLKRSESED